MSRIMAVAASGIVICTVSRWFRREQSRVSDLLHRTGKRAGPNNCNKTGDIIILEKCPDTGTYRSKP